MVSFYKDKARKFVELHPFDLCYWTGQSDPYESKRACYWYELISGYRPQPPDQPTQLIKPSQKVGLVGFVCDQGIRRSDGRVGSKFASDDIRQVFAKLPCSVQLMDKYGTQRNGRLANLIGDIGNVECLDGDTFTFQALENTQHEFSQKIYQILGFGGFAIGLGGDHSMAYGSFLGLWKHLKYLQSVPIKSTTHANKVERPAMQKIGMINFDTQLDINQSDMSTAHTAFKQIGEHLQAYDEPFHYLCIGVSQFANTAAIFDRAKKMNVQIITDNECHRNSWKQTIKQLQVFMSQVDALYVSIDMSCFVGSYVPGVSKPAVKGITLDFVELCLEVIFDSHKVKVADIAEINPKHDIDSMSTRMAAHLLAQMVELQIAL